MALRIVGADMPGAGGQPLQAPNQLASIQDTTSQNLAQADQSVQKGIAVTQQSVEASQQESAKRSQILAQREDPLADALKTTGKLVDQFTKIQAAKTEAKQDNAYANTALQVEDALFNLRTTVQKEGYQKGLFNARERVRSLIVSSTDLSADAKRMLIQRTYSAIDDVDREFFKNALDESQNIKRSQVSQAEYETRLKASNILARISFGADAMNEAAVKSGFDEVEKMADEVAKQSGFDDYQRQEFKTRILKTALDAGEVSAKVRAEAEARLSTNVNWFNETAELKAALESGAIDYPTYRAMIEPINAKYGYSLEKEPAGQTEAMQYESKLLQNQLTYQKAVEENFLLNYDAATLSEQDITEQAMALVNDPSRKAQYERLATIDNKRVLERAKQLEQGIPTVQRGQQQLAGKAKEIAVVRAEIAKLEQIRNLNPMQLAQMKASGMNIPDVNKMGELQTKLAGLNQEYNTMATQVQTNLTRLQGVGLVFDANGNAALDPKIKAEREKIQQAVQSGQLKPPSFSRGGGVSQRQPQAQLAKMSFSGAGQRYVPFLPGDVKKVSFTSDFGSRNHPISGGVKHHDGIDLAAPTGTPTTALRSGVITRAGWLSGYGNTVEIKMPDGKFALYAHLESINVKKGQTVAQGQVVGKVGSTGDSTGAHLHLAIFKDEQDRTGVNPIDYLKTVAPETGSTVARGLGLPPQQQGSLRPSTSRIAVATEVPPAGAKLLPLGGYIWNSKLYLPKQRYDLVQQNYAMRTPLQEFNHNYADAGDASKYVNGARRIPGSRASNKLDDYRFPNNPNANYGYKAIANDAKFAKALAATADRLRIPAQWLADVMAFETGGSFDSSMTNGIGATGLIQFMPDTASGLGTSTAALRSMSRTQQLAYVEKYFKQGIQEVGAFKRLDDVFAYIWGGGGLARTADNRRVGVSDGSIRYEEYIERIGEQVGRSYAHGLFRGANRVANR